MQTRVFADHLRDLVTGIKAEKIHALLSKYFISNVNIAIVPDDKEQFASLVFGIQAYLHSLEGDQATLAEELGFTALLAAPALARLLTTFQSATSRANIVSDEPFLSLYHSSAAAIRLNRTVRRYLIAPKELVEESRAILSLEVVDYFGQGVELKRLAFIADALRVLYDAVDQLLGTQSTPTVAYADSGSDLNLGLEGAKGVIQAVGELFDRVWERIRYRKNDDLAKNFETLTKGMDVLSVIQGQHAAGVLDSETAGKLQISVRKQLTELVAAGVITESASDYQQFDRRGVLSSVKEQKLLRAGNDNENLSDAPHLDV